MTRPFLALMGLLILTSACGSDDSPTTPTTQNPVPTPPATPVPTPPAPTAALTITPSTLQAAWGQTPAGFSADCAGKPNFWQWEVTITETAGVPVTLTRGVTIADGQVLSTTTLSESIPARGSVTRRPYQCWILGSIGHVAQTAYSGTDANGHDVSVTSPNITLLKRP